MAEKILIGLGLFLLLVITVLAWYLYPFLGIPEPMPQEYEKSIAVLYFDDISAADESYFSDGLTEELISRLARIVKLKVASRTDVKIYRNNPSSITQVGKDLKVDFVVEGSVRKSGDQIRITAQLISTEDGFHRWAETYDRETTDIFKVQDDVAVNIAQRLDIEISNRTKSAITESPTDSLEAYDLVLTAKSKFAALNGLSSESVFEEIEAMLEKAVLLDPSYMDARSVLTSIYSIHLIVKRESLSIHKKEWLYNKTLATAKKTLSLDAKNEMALTILPITLTMKATGFIGGTTDFNPLLYRRIKTQINRLAVLYPESAVANVGIGTYFYLLNAMDLQIGKKNNAEMMLTYFDKAIATLEKTLKTTPNDPLSLYLLYSAYSPPGLYYFDEGRYEEALPYLNRLNELYEQIGNEAKFASTFILASIADLMGEYKSAIGYYKRQLILIDEFGDEGLEETFGDSMTVGVKLMPYYFMGGIHLKQNNYEEAFSCYKTMLDASSNEEWKGLALSKMGETKFLTGSYGEANDLFTAALKCCTADTGGTLNVLSWQALIHLQSGKQDSALIKVNEIEKQHYTTDPDYESEFIISINWNLSQVYAELGQIKKSHHHLELAHNEVMKKVEEMKDFKARQCYLTHIRNNRNVVAAWEQLN